MHKNGESWLLLFFYVILLILLIFKIKLKNLIFLFSSPLNSNSISTGIYNL